MERLIGAAACLLLGVVPAVAQDLCGDASLAVQVLGSGGPFAGSGRASTSYLVWREGRAVVMVDVGGGAFLRFGEAGARLHDLQLLAISHLHPDHVADLPGLLWLSDAARDRPLAVVGPSGGGAFPDIETFLTRLFDPEDGAFPVLGGVVGLQGRGARLDVTVVPSDFPIPRAPMVVFSDDDLEVRAMGVPHSGAGTADVATPSLAYRVDVGGRSVVFSSDQNGGDTRFLEFAHDVDLLVMHLAASDEAPPAIQDLHATPTVVGRIARQARVGRLVLSHIIETPVGYATPEVFSGYQLEENVARVRRMYPGPVEVASDLQCFVLE